MSSSAPLRARRGGAASGPSRVTSRVAGALLLVVTVLGVLLGALAGSASAAPALSSPALSSPAALEPLQPVPTQPAPTDSDTDSTGPESTEQSSTGPRLVATLTVGTPPEPVEGVTMIVSRNGQEVARADSDADGKIAVELPEGGAYDVTLDEESFPEGIGFAEGARTELSPIVQSAGDRPVIFRLAEEGATGVGGVSSAQRFINLFASGLRFGLVIALAAVGLSLIFGTTGLTNFAHGELLTFGALATWFLNSNQDGLGWPLLLAALGGIILSGLFGASFELAVFGPLRRRGMPVVSQMVVSIGLAIALRYVFNIFYGAGSRQYAQYAAQSPSLDLGVVALRPKDLVVTLLALAAVIAIGLFLEKSRSGTAIRAVSDNADLSTASGINTGRVILLVWVLAGVFGGAGGIMLGVTDIIHWNMGPQVLLIMFAAVLLGGLGTPYGAIVGGIFIGVVSDLSTYWLDADLKIVVALGALVLVLLVRPQGVFGVRARTA